jgi:putative endonuclease
VLDLTGRSERRLPRRSPKGEGGLSTRPRFASYGSASQSPDEESIVYVYILRSIGMPERYYVGVTEDLRSRMLRHNAGEVPHTSKYAPWTIKTYVAFSDENQAFAFEKYLKPASGRAFAKKRL